MRRQVARLKTELDRVSLEWDDEEKEGVAPFEQDIAPMPIAGNEESSELQNHTAVEYRAECGSANRRDNEASEHISDSGFENS